MRSAIRKPSIKKSISAKTTGKAKRTIKKATNPVYGKKGMGYIHDPKRAIYNKVYKKTSVGLGDISQPKAKSSSYHHSPNSEDKEQTSGSHLTITNSNLPQLVSECPEIIETLRKSFIKKLCWGLIFLIVAGFLFFISPLMGFVSIGIAIYNFYKSYKSNLAYNDARKIYWNNKLNL